MLKRGKEIIYADVRVTNGAGKLLAQGGRLLVVGGDGDAIGISDFGHVCGRYEIALLHESHDFGGPPDKP